MEFPQKLNIELPYDPAIPLLDIYPEEILIQKDTCTPVFSSASQSCLTLCHPMDCSMPGFLVHHQLPEFTQTHVHCVGDTIHPSHPLSSPSPPALNLSQHQGLFQYFAKVLEFQLQHQSFQ